MGSEIPLKSKTFRITPDDYVTMLNEAAEAVKPYQDALESARLGDYQRRLERALSEREDPSLEVRQLAEARERFEQAVSPRWYLVTKQGRRDSPEGSVDEIAPSISVPRKYSYASVKLRGGDHSIDISLGVTGAEILISGSDQKWLRQVERWARQELQTHRPSWWWIRKRWVYWTGVVVASLIYFPVAFGSLALGVDRGISSLLGVACSWAVVIALAVTANLRRAVIVEPGATRGRAFWTQLGLLLVGAVAGAIVSRLFDAIFPAK